MAYLLKAYRYLNLLSVDVALGAVCCALFFAKILAVHILPYGLLLLALTVWIIYTADHLLDGKRMKTSASTERHLFHQRYFNVLVGMMVIAVAIQVMLIFFIEQQVLLSGVLLALFTGFFLLLPQYFKYVKEFTIALVYTTGILLPAVLTTDLAFRDLPWIVIAQFALVAFINLLVFSWFDYEHDVHSDSTSFVILFGKKATLVSIGLALAIVGLLTVFSTTQVASFIILSMALAHLGVCTQYRWFAKNDRYRLVGDGVFMLPALYIFFNEDLSGF